MPKSDRPPTLALAMIARNEEENLRELLPQLGDAFDEIVLVDTGSKDGTVEAARESGVKILHHPWNDDFAEARNVGLEECESDWIFVLDPDERVVGGRYSDLRALATTRKDLAYRFQARNICDRPEARGWRPFEPSDPAAKEGPGAFPSFKVRMFPNLPGVRFRGRVHELVNDDCERLGLNFVESEIVIDHSGENLSPEAIHSKNEYYLRLGQLKVEEEPENPKAHYELGNQLVELGRLEEAGRSYRQALQLAPQSPHMLRSMGGVLDRLGELDESIDLLDKAVRLEPEDPLLIADLGILLAKAGRFENAIPYLDRALKELDYSPTVRYARALCFESVGEVQDALADLGESLRQLPQNEEVLDHLVEMSAEKSVIPQAIQILEELMADSPPLALPLAALGTLHLKVGERSRAVDCYETAYAWEPNNPRILNDLGVFYFSEGNVTKAVELLKKALHIHPDYEDAKENLKAILAILKGSTT